MPGTGSYIGGSASADYFYTAPELLSQLPDNTANLIVAKDIRDSVWTLWNRIDDVQLLASQSASASSFYMNATPVPIAVGGIAAGVSFSTPRTMQQMFDQLLYPYIPPSCSLSGGNTREFGSGTVISLTWGVTKGSNLITTIIVNGFGSVPPPTGYNQSGNVMGPYNATQNVTTTFNMSVSDGTSTPGASTTVYWSNRRYWGTSTSFAALISNQILALGGITVAAGIGAIGSEFASTMPKNLNGINGAGNYLVFAWPTSFGTPAFVVNNLPNTAFTKVNNAYAFTNQFGYITNYDVWMSNTQYNSPVALFQIN